MPPRLFIERGWVDGAGLEYAAVLRGAGGSRATAEIVRSAPVAATGTGVVLAPALTKGARLDLVVRKATELGAAAGFAWVGLGPRVLRAETAALAALAVLAYEIDR